MAGMGWDSRGRIIDRRSTKLGGSAARFGGAAEPGGEADSTEAQLGVIAANREVASTDAFRSAMASQAGQGQLSVGSARRAIDKFDAVMSGGDYNNIRTSPRSFSAQPSMQPGGLKGNWDAQLQWSAGSMAKGSMAGSQARWNEARKSFGHDGPGGARSFRLQDDPFGTKLQQISNNGGKTYGAAEPGGEAGGAADGGETYGAAEPGGGVGGDMSSYGATEAGGDYANKRSFTAFGSSQLTSFRRGIMHEKAAEKLGEMMDYPRSYGRETPTVSERTGQQFMGDTRTAKQAVVVLSADARQRIAARMKARGETASSYFSTPDVRVVDKEIVAKARGISAAPTGVGGGFAARVDDATNASYDDDFKMAQELFTPRRERSMVDDKASAAAAERYAATLSKRITEGRRSGRWVSENLGPTVLSDSEVSSDWYVPNPRAMYAKEK